MDALFPEEGGTGTALAITDREVAPLDTDLANAMIDLGEELLRPPEVGRRVRRQIFDRDAEPTGTAHATDTDYPNSKGLG